MKTKEKQTFWEIQRMQLLEDNANNTIKVIRMERDIEFAQSLPWTYPHYTLRFC